MKINVTNAIIAFILSVLITYGIVNIEDNSMRMLTAIGGFVFIFITSFFAIGITYKLPRTGVVLRIVSIVFFSIGLLSNIVFSLITFSEVSYVVTNGSLILIFALISKSIYSDKQ